MTEVESPSVFVQFMREARDGFNDVRKQIEDGKVPSGASAKLTIEMTPDMVDQVRFEMLAAMARDGDVSDG